MISALHTLLTKNYPKNFNIRNTLMRQGYVGGFPYLAIFRILIVAGTVLRFEFHSNDYSAKMWVVLSILFAFSATLATIELFKSLQQRSSNSWQLFLLISDILLISIYYFLTYTIESDFYLFYFLPLFTAAEYFYIKALNRTAIAVSFSFLIVLSLISYSRVPSFL